MVRDRVTDGYRVGELLASEVDGRRRGPLGDLAVANADRSVTGSPDGERAYDVRFVAGDRDPRREPTPDDAGTLVARAYVHEEGVRLEVVAGAEAAAAAAEDGGLTVERASGAERTEGSEREPDSEPASEGAAAPGFDGVAIRVEYGAQAKRAADALAAASAAIDPDR